MVIVVAIQGKLVCETGHKHLSIYFLVLKFAQSLLSKGIKNFYLPKNFCLGAYH